MTAYGYFTILKNRIPGLCGISFGGSGSGSWGGGTTSLGGSSNKPAPSPTRFSPATDKNIHLILIPLKKISKSVEHMIQSM